MTAPFRQSLLAVTGAGVVATCAGIVLSPDRTWPNLLLANTYLMSLALGGVLFVALQYVSHAGWATVIRRVPEAMTLALPVSGVVMILILFGIPSLYEWSHPSAVEHSHVLQAKAGWLNAPFFVIRTVAYIGLWIALSSLILRYSRAQDLDGSIDHTLRNRRVSASFIVVFAFTFTLASMDWIMSLQPHWYSTIFGVYNFSGLFLNALATITVVVILLRRRGYFGTAVTEAHLHDLGKLIFAFSTFWMYIWFSQYILIWYANIPEEVRFYTMRSGGGWLTLTIVNVLFNWLIPFVVLMPAWAKRSEGLLLRVCMIVMLGHWIDLFWMILPPFMKDGPTVSLWELAPMTAGICGFFLLTFTSLGKHKIFPVKDPYLGESLAQDH